MADQNATPAPKPEDNPFAAAFAELSKDADTPVIVPAPDAVLDGAAAADAAAAEAAKPATIEIEGVLPKPEEVAADGTDPAAKAAAGAAAATAAPDAAAPAAAAPAGAPTDAELAERFRRLMADSGVAAPAAAAPAAAPAAKAEEPPPAVTPYSDAENELIANYQKEWPEIYAAEQAMQRRNAQAVVDHVFKTLNPILQQLMGTTTEIAKTSHSEQLQAAIPDIIEVAPKVLAWVETQPDYLKETYTKVVTTGTVKQVADLVGRFRAETGAPAPGTAPAPAPAPALTVVQPAPAAAKLAKGLAPTQGKRSGVQSDVISSDDFEGAFAAFSQVA